MLPSEDISRLKKELNYMQEMRSDINKKLFCLGVITAALDTLNETIVLFGGTAVEYYTFGGYEGNDVDIFGTNEDIVLGVLKQLGFEGGADHWETEHFPWTIHFPFTEEDIQWKSVSTLKIDENYKIHIIRLENAIVDQLWKIIEGDDSNLYYALARDMIEYHRANIDYGYLHELANGRGEKLGIILRTIEALLNLETQT